MVLGTADAAKVGEPAEESFAATAARDDQHEYDGRSLRETDRGGCRADGGSVVWRSGYSLRATQLRLRGSWLVLYLVLYYCFFQEYT